MTEQIRRQRKETGRMGIAKRHTERGQEQAGMSREGRRTMEKVLENMVRDICTRSLLVVVVNKYLVIKNKKKENNNIPRGSRRI